MRDVSIYKKSNIGHFGHQNSRQSPPKVPVCSTRPQPAKNSMSHPTLPKVALLVAQLCLLVRLPAVETRKYPASAFDQTGLVFEKTTGSPEDLRVVLIPGSEMATKPSGDHEYLAGCALLMEMLQNIEGVHPVLVQQDWPKNEAILEKANVLVVYSNGDGKQGFLQNEQRRATLERLMGQGVGFVQLHAAVSYPKAYADLGCQWAGGVWTEEHSKGSRGHWKSTHAQFPDHPILRGVTPWEAHDGWLHQIHFPSAYVENITPLLWSSKKNQGAPMGGMKDVVAWAYTRENQGRSFSCSGAHGHWEWANDGLRQMIINGILWTAHQEIPEHGFPAAIDKDQMNRNFDPRKPAKK